MSEVDDLALPRAGSTADLVRRIDRVEKRQDSLETKVDGLLATVARLEANQAHATEIEKLRFDALEHGIAALNVNVEHYTARFEGIMTGELKTAAARELEAAKAEAERVSRPLMEDWAAWRREVDALHEQRDIERAKNAGAVIALRGIKGAAIAMAVVLGPVIAVIGLVLELQK